MDAGSKARRRKISLDSSRSALTERANKLESQKLQKHLASMEANAHKNMVYLFKRRLSTQDVLAYLQRQEGDSCLANRENRPRPPPATAAGDRPLNTERNTGGRPGRARSRSMDGADKGQEHRDTPTASITGLRAEALQSDKSGGENIFEDCLQNLKIDQETSDSVSDLKNKPLPQLSRPKSAPLRWRRHAEDTVTSSADSTPVNSTVHTSEIASPRDQMKTSPLRPVNFPQELPTRIPRGMRMHRPSDRGDTGSEIPGLSSPDGLGNAAESARGGAPQADDLPAQHGEVDSSKEGSNSPGQPQKPRLLTRAEKLGIRPVLLSNAGGANHQRHQRSISVTIRPTVLSSGSPTSPDARSRPSTVVPRVRKISAMSHIEFMNDAIRSRAYGLPDSDLSPSGEAPVLLPPRPHTAGGARKLHQALAKTEQRLDARLQEFLKRPLPGETKHDQLMTAVPSP